jgi:hypothetical protein
VMPLKFRPATPILSTGAVQPSSTPAMREFTACRTLCSIVWTYTSPVVVMLACRTMHIRTQRPSHHLKGDEVVGDSQLTGDRTHAPGQEVLSPAGTACPFRSPRPNVGNIRASGEESAQSCRQFSMTGRTNSGTGIGALLCFVLNLPT